jgi:hypothetical protein
VLEINVELPAIEIELPSWQCGIFYNAPFRRRYEEKYSIDAKGVIFLEREDA